MKLFCVSALYFERASTFQFSLLTIYLNLFSLLWIVLSFFSKLYQYLLCPAQYCSTLIYDLG